MRPPWQSGGLRRASPPTLMRLAGGSTRGQLASAEDEQVKTRNVVGREKWKIRPEVGGWNTWPESVHAQEGAVLLQRRPFNTMESMEQTGQIFVPAFLSLELFLDKSRGGEASPLD